MNLIIDDLVNDITDRHLSFNAQDCELIYSSTHSGSKLRILAAFDISFEIVWTSTTYNYCHEDTYKILYEKHPEVGWDVFQIQCRYMEQLCKVKPTSTNHVYICSSCEFHVHSGGKSCASQPRQDDFHKRNKNELWVGYTNSREDFHDISV